MPVTKLEVKNRQLFAQGEKFGQFGSYELLDGTVHFAVDPDHPDNGLITDLKLATRNGSGRVVFSSDFRILIEEA